MRQQGYFGGQSLQSLSHGQSLLTYFETRYKLKGLYLLDEPETALSPRSQLKLSGILQAMGEQGHAQFIIATHSPILLACPSSQILSLDGECIESVDYKDTDNFEIYYDFMLSKRSI